MVFKTEHIGGFCCKKTRVLIPKIYVDIFVIAFCVFDRDRDILDAGSGAQNDQKIGVAYAFCRSLSIDCDLLAIPCPCCRAAGILSASIRPHREDRTKELYQQKNEERQESVLRSDHDGSL